MKPPKLPDFPKPPKISQILPESPLGPLGDVIDDVNTLIKKLEGAGVKRPSVEVPAPSKPTGVSDKETLAYQLDHLLDEISLLETHLAEKGRIAGKECDCIEKSARRVKAFASETIPIMERQGKKSEMMSLLATWAKAFEEIGSEEAVKSGKFDETYAKESGTASKFRKELERMKNELDVKAFCAECAELESLKEWMEKRKAQREKR